MNQNNKRPFLGIVTILAITLGIGLSIGTFAQMTKAFSSGVTGFSGASGPNCNQCHIGGTEPTVTLSGPTIAFPEEVLTYTLTVAGGQALAAGLDVAVTNGVLTDSLAGGVFTQVLGGEIIHENSDPTQKSSTNYPSYSHDGGPKCINSDCTQVPGGEVVFTFNWIAPATADSVTMFGAGNSVDLSSDNTGDRTGLDTLTITVFDPASFTDHLYLPLVVTE